MQMDQFEIFKEFLFLLTWIKRPQPAHSSTPLEACARGSSIDADSGLLGFAMGSVFSWNIDGLPSPSLLLLLLLLGGVIASFLSSVK